MLKDTFSKLKDIQKRHQERHDVLGCQFVIADRIDFVCDAHWDAIAGAASVFLSRPYLEVLEQFNPPNTEQRYAIVYDNDKPIVILACQIARLSGDQFTDVSEQEKPKDKLVKCFEERVLVCGNLVSSGLHGVAFAKHADVELAWRAVSEVLYRIRRAEKLGGNIDFVMIKDLKGKAFDNSGVLKRYSYRPIQTDPDMVLSFEEGCESFDGYLACLTSKYRSRIKRMIADLEKAGFSSKLLSDIKPYDAELHRLYTEVENRAATRPASLPPGYFGGLAEALGERFLCTAIFHNSGQKDEKMVGFITTIKDKSQALAYYVGVDYQVNADFPIYLRLLQINIEHALKMKCETTSFGRTALEPKASLGAKPVDTHIWVRHRVPLVNFFIRKLFPIIPYSEAPERNPLKSDKQ